MKREENQTIEYKESWHDKYLEWIGGYANAKGGTLYIGIEDGTKKPIGVKNPNKLMEDIPNSIRNTMAFSRMQARFSTTESKLSLRAGCLTVGCRYRIAQTFAPSALLAGIQLSPLQPLTVAPLTVTPLTVTPLTVVQWAGDWFDCCAL